MAAPLQAQKIPREAPKNAGVIENDAGVADEPADTMGAAANLLASIGAASPNSPNRDAFIRIANNQLSNLRNGRMLWGPAGFLASAATASNKCEPVIFPSFPTITVQRWWNERVDPNNYQRWKRGDWDPLPGAGGGGGSPRYCPSNSKGVRLVPATASNNLKNLLLASVIVHEGGHCEQDHEEPPVPPGPPPGWDKPKNKSRACNEVEAHKLQLDLLCRGYDFMEDLGLLPMRTTTPQPVDVKAFNDYKAWIEAELKIEEKKKKDNS